MAKVPVREAGKFPCGVEARPHAGIEAAETRMVEKIKHLGPELKAVLFLHFPILCHRKVDVSQPRLPDKTTFEIPKSSGRGQGECGGIQIERLVRPVQIDRLAGNQIRTVAAIGRGARQPKIIWIHVSEHVKRSTAQQGDDSIKLPTSQDMAR